MDAYRRINGDPAGTRTQNYSLGGYRDILFHHGVTIFDFLELANSKGFHQYCDDTASRESWRCLSFLHVCGGVSVTYQGKTKDALFSPRMWRCFLNYPSKTFAIAIFSTYVGVFPTSQCLAVLGWDFLHLSNQYRRSFLLYEKPL